LVPIRVFIGGDWVTPESGRSNVRIQSGYASQEHYIGFVAVKK
jgi:hypothetical protein